MLFSLAEAIALRSSCYSISYTVLIAYVLNDYHQTYVVEEIHSAQHREDSSVKLADKSNLNRISFCHSPCVVTQYHWLLSIAFEVCVNSMPLTSMSNLDVFAAVLRGGNWGHVFSVASWEKGQFPGSSLRLEDHCTLIEGFWRFNYTVTIILQTY